jgi:hypothetical protein
MTENAERPRSISGWYRALTARWGGVDRGWRAVLVAATVLVGTLGELSIPW